jgi:CoA:oxalate CoA-transferase
MQAEETLTAPLAGLRVLDFSIMLAGPYCARLLADVGAEVIKIEPPEGDDMRLRTPLRDGHSAYFGQLNAGKRSLALDLKNAEAIRLIHRLVADTDIVVENFRPGVMDRLGLGYEALREINPRLIYCSISGYGQSGPDAERAAYAMIVHAESGFDWSLMRYAGDRDRPAAGAIFVADVLGGIFGYSAIQTALVQRSRTGKGQRIDVALMDCMLNLLVYELQEAQFPIRAPRPTYGPVRAKDGDILIAPVTARNFDALCEVTGQGELANDPRFNALPARGANWTAMMQVVEKWTERHTADECLAALDAAGVPCARYRDPGAALTDPHLLARGSFATVSDGAGEFVGVNAPWKMSGAETSIGREIPAIGAHRDEVLSRALGLSPAAIASLADTGAFGRSREEPKEKQKRRQEEPARGLPG